jgi:cytochrome c oxidase assembly protein subunit 15
VRRPELSPGTYQRVALVAALLLAVIIVTGGAVRLSGSGLGCPDWPTCGRSIGHGPEAGHALIEFANRMVTGLVSVAVIVAVLGAFFRVPRRRDLVVLALGLVVGVFAQAVLGGMTVIFDLQPQLVMAHFLLSLVLLTNAIVLHRRAGEPDLPAQPTVTPVIRSLGRALLVVVAVVVTTGTVVTATGPHGGDKEVVRFDFHIPTVAKIHGISVAVFCVLVVGTLWLLWRTRAPRPVLLRLALVLGVALAQAAIGYIQYFNDIPPLLVGFHIAGATALWAAVVSYYLALSTRAEPPPAGWSPERVSFIQDVVPASRSA